MKRISPNILHLAAFGFVCNERVRIDAEIVVIKTKMP